MEIRTIHGPRSATLSIVGEITDEGAATAVAEIDHLANSYFYPEVVIEITSDGGPTQALDHLVEAMDRWSRTGPRVITRVPMRANSAAALLVSAGAVREAARHATLNYHGARIPRPEMVTRQGAAFMESALASTDKASIRRLAERVLAAAPREAPPEQAAKRLSGFDPAVLKRITVPKAKRSGTVERIQAIRRLLADCRAGNDRKPLEALLKRLFDADVSISASLALELGLLDRVLPSGGTSEANAGTAAGPALRVPEWEALHEGGMVDEALLRRHVLILGESGSGKTASGVLPLAAALGRSPERLACALVIDPKRELLERLEAAAHADVSVRRLKLDEDPAGLCVMGSEAEALREDVRAGRVITAATRILMRVDSLDPNDATGALCGRMPASHDPYWPREGGRMAIAVLAFALMLMNRVRRVAAADGNAHLAGNRNPPAKSDDDLPDGKVRWLIGDASAASDEASDASDRGCGDEGLDLALAGASTPAAAVPPPSLGHRLPKPSSRLLGDFKAACAPGPDGSPGLNVVASADWLLRKAFWPTARKQGEVVLSPREPLPAAKLAQRLIDHEGLHDEERDALGRVEFHCMLNSGPGRNGHYLGIAGQASTAFAAFAEPGVARALHFGVESARADTQADALDLPRLVDGELGPTVLVHQPARGGHLAARALKAMFFEAVLESPKRRTNGTSMPLAAYVADEFHRFVTSGQEHGEQSFLDTCRSFGCACILACQGIASVRHALAGAGAGDAGSHAVDVLLINTASKMFFRTSERASLNILDSLAPLVNGNSLTSVRPPSAMAPGECYAALGDGRFERRQLGMLAEDPPERERERRRQSADGADIGESPVPEPDEHQPGLS